MRWPAAGSTEESRPHFPNVNTLRDLPAIDGLRLSGEMRALLRPGEPVQDRLGRTHRLPRFFYAVRSWSQAKELALSPHLRLSELMTVDCHENPRLLEEFPHYVPCAIVLLAQVLENFRQRAGASVYVAANGGYRSPAHKLSAPANVHNWAAAADIYRVGDTWLNTPAAIEKYGALARELGVEIHALPYGHQAGETDDHLHLDLGYCQLVPGSCDEAVDLPV
jgi:hypothetical protein